MFQLKILFILFNLFIFFLFNSCIRDFGTNIPDTETFSLDYNESGGVGGMNNTLTISKSDSIVYLGHDYDFSTKAAEEDLNFLFLVLNSNSFFSMDSAYLPDQRVADDIIFRISYHSDSKSHIVIASGCCSNSKWPKGLINIVDYLQGYVIELKSKINSGKVIVTKKMILEEWPFSDRIKLSDHLYKNVDVDEEIFKHIREPSNQDVKVSFFEGEWIYRLNASNSGELSSYYISIHDRNKPILWPFKPKLADIPENGINLVGQDYFWIKRKLKEIHYPRYLIDGLLESGEYIYEINLINGNSV